ncbi:LPXTG cell wall anchor domain-containing protein [Streptococcus suis]|uniref:LPXTG cell wall anchor domain-containing protein n=1 Tax=Streptococcus suis TaxID=1307 RepID=UPI00192D5C47|nr:LPXTG cell wall anchor domain-containing protein [Streptococcus suis]MBL6504372.1 LPXTG cell wall anchor domain-containing protein [Streptococcus suis]MBM0241988.1 LPXTG cell wall anchor domain-containing protein [Streptococcus suis]MBM7180575.1 LPXTG cell wall anchor domain-containing protein [Streptococcus suis]MBM7205075.1 LPXTG cell wall anchor domain-containing protein [Streptococcus suis]MBM7282484.1 LPXTG cell wall anchor domain-containing protein [Streptococcus suis]
MNKKFVLSGLLLSTLLLSPSVFADEVVDTVTTPIVVVEQPIEVPVEEPSTPVEAPTEPIEEPTTPVETPIEPIEVPTVPDPVTPIEEPTTPIETPTDPVEEPATPTVPSETPTEPKEADPVSPTTPTTPSNPVPQEPSQPVYIEDTFVSDTGYTVVGVQGESILVQDEVGQVQSKTLEEVGAVKDTEGNVTVKSSSGEVKLLPNTGERAEILTAVGFVLLMIMLFVKRKEIKSVLKELKKVADKGEK